jgi:hypothetical protein
MKLYSRRRSQETPRVPEWTPSYHRSIEDTGDGMRLPRWCGILAIVMVAGACSSAPSGPALPPLHGEGRRVLFIGNSLTYWNDLPLIVKALADAAIESYTLAAQDVSGTLFPVASAWLAAWRRDGALLLYSADGLHPSVAGSYLAALVMYAALYDRSPVGLPARVRLISGSEIGVTAAVAAVLQEAVAEVAR